MHPEETKVHRRGLVLVPGLAANHEAQPPLDPDCARKAAWTPLAHAAANPPL